MKTIDIHTHLLNPNVKFDRLFDRIALRFFGKGLGLEPESVKNEPYKAYVKALARTVSQTKHLERACLFGVDSRLDEQGREIDCDKTVCSTTEDVLQVTEQYPNEFIPFFTINPLRPNALDLIDEYIERGCRGAKFLQNYWGVDLNNEQYVPYYEKLKSWNIPLIIHIGSEYSVDSYERFERIEMLDLPLACGVTVIAAHMGLGRINHKFLLWRNLSKNPRHFDSDYFQLLDMLRRHNNLYADISAILSPFRARALRHLSEQHDVHPKILFGSDYPVPFTIRFNSYDLPTERRREINAIKNPFDRYITAMLEYFPAGNPIYSNYTKVLA
jgi:predicted TIM-barrel fold metal-dependent hydrolase